MSRIGRGRVAWGARATGAHIPRRTTPKKESICVILLLPAYVASASGRWRLHVGTSPWDERCLLPCDGRSPGAPASAIRERGVRPFLPVQIRRARESREAASRGSFWPRFGQWLSWGPGVSREPGTHARGEERIGSTCRTAGRPGGG